MTVTVYGIPNCDTIKKARKWLEGHDVAYAFHDYKKAGIDEPQLTRWIEAVGWEPLLNKRGTTYRKLSDDDKADIDAAKAARLMAANPSMIKRPVVEGAGDLIVGFDEQVYADRLT
ncbi:ArsC family reductase [Novosphingopyxis baekryungensis]|uniref:ArsC family reductase n=1 Tax=Novosphingopyxis baekryungensis TaxID=279369 RepID=UPI0003B50F9C|nr:ArsC family reductase [Novosphingopyxis baekryungensis]